MPRFATVTDEEAREIEAGRNAERTKRATELMTHILVAYINEKQININRETATKPSVNNSLQQFYFEVRKNDGS